MVDVEVLSDELPAIVAELEGRLPYASALAMGRRVLEITADSREQRISQGDPASGVVLTGWAGGQLHEYGTSTLAPGALLAEARAWAAGLPADAGGPAPEPGPARRGRFATSGRIDPAAVPLREKFDRVVDLQRRAAALDRRVVNARVGYVETIEEKVFASRTRLLSERRSSLLLAVTLVVGQNGVLQYDWTYRSGQGGLELVELPEEALERLRDSALALLGATPIEPGEYDVVTAPSVSGLIAHESFGHGVELDMFLKGRARAAHYVGRRVGSELVNIRDDPSVPGAYGSYFFDDEGEPARPTEIVRNGVFERGLSDLYSAFRLGVPRTPNGRRESYLRKVYPRMSNTFFAPGETPPEELLAGIERGVFLAKGRSGMEDPQGWGIQLTVHYGREIRGGRLTDRVFAPIGVTGYVPDLLASVSGVSSGLELEPGTCGKGHKEMVPVSSGGPHLRLRARLG